MQSHVRGLFASAEEGSLFVARLLEASYSHFELDEPNAPGLLDKIRQARAHFPDVACEPSKFAEFRATGANVRRTAQRATNMDLTSILLSEYLQDTVALVLDDPLKTDPFLRWIQTHWIQ